MGQAVSPSKNASSHVTEPPLRVQPRKLKRCASHIYISRLIKELQTSTKSSSNQNEQRSSETSQRKLPDPVTTTISDFKSMAFPSKSYQNPHLFDLHKAHNPKPSQEDMAKLALELYGPQTSHKQVHILHCSYSCKSLYLSDSNLDFFYFEYRTTIFYLSHLMEQQQQHNLISQFQIHFHSTISLQLTIAISHLQLLAIRFLALTQISLFACD